MRKILMDAVVPGMKIAKTIFDTNGRVLLVEGVILKDNYIARLKNSNISEIYIEDDISEGIIITDVVRESTRADAKFAVKKIMTGNTFCDAIESENLLKIIENLIEDLLDNDDIIINLANIRNVDDYTFEHSVNVCIISLIIGIGMGYDLKTLKELGVGAILHDIGKLKIRQEILKKPTQLTKEEFEEIKKHTIFGYEILRQCKNISIKAALIAFGHHERYNGSGYPLMIKINDIDECCRIVAVADVFDALTSDRVYRKRLKPHEVVEYITSLSGQHFEPKIIDVFIKFVAVYPLGSGVILNNNEKAIVVRNNKSMPTKPLVRVVYDEAGNKLNEFRLIDLSKIQNIFITKACDL